jgi:hypothetical protein
MDRVLGRSKTAEVESRETPGFLHTNDKQLLRIAAMKFFK